VSIHGRQLNGTGDIRARDTQLLCWVLMNCCWWMSVTFSLHSALQVALSANKQATKLKSLRIENLTN